MSARATFAILLVTGCGFQAQPTHQGLGDDAPVMVDGPGGNGGGDSGSGTGSTNFCVSDAMVTACLPQKPTMSITISAPTAIDTDKPDSCAAETTGSSGNYCIFAGASITIAAGQTLSAHGSRPLVLLSSTAITVAGTIDVAGHLSGAPQPAGPASTTCAGATPASSSGGGYGGSLGSLGGDGGTDSGAHLGGKAPPIVAPTTLRGGCNGEQGANNGGSAGGGGGGLAVLAMVSIDVQGSINASGGGGGAGAVNPGNRGGGGGGGGGMIVIDAPVVSGVLGKIFANGGSGGEASGGNIGNVGNDAPLDPTVAAQGGAGGSSGGDGGVGAINNAQGGNAATSGGTGTSAAGGGGGGGGTGIIKLYKAAALPGMVSPPPT
ncbi:MAG TPA: hypothetical protein VH165_05035 [Kofleriaceae bacterium]|nr:hypothetical protein [Kofleriaceae bacterium]